MSRPVSPRGTGSAPLESDRVPGCLIRSVAELRAVIASERADGASVGLVPTMGALHAGHLSLISHAHRHCDVVVVSVFVNPTQFDEQADLDAYPRRLRSDARAAFDAGADIVFAPSVDAVYPAGFSTCVQIGGPAEGFEGEQRGAAHFNGVATVVLKLLNMSTPDVAYFGAKDAQQVMVVRRLVRDLDLAVRIEALPTVREADGLAMSSRNSRLSAQERRRACAIHSALQAAAAVAMEGHDSAELLISTARRQLQRASIEPEYLALVDRESCRALDRLDRPALLLVAARLGRTRLIDNIALEPIATTVSRRPPRSAEGPSKLRHRQRTVRIQSPAETRIPA